MEKWPSLSSVSEDNSDGESMVKEVAAKVVNDKVSVADDGGQDKSKSFVKAVQGLSQNGCNKLRITTSMCDRAYGRANFARVLVEIDAARGLKEYVEEDKKNPTVPVVNRSDVREGDWRNVEYKKYKRNNLMNAGSNVQRNYVGESSNIRGGYVGRGRGGSYGRGFGSQRVNKPNQFVPTKKVLEIVVEKAKVSSQDKGKSIDVEKGQGASEEGRNLKSKNVESSNRYAVLSENIEDMENVEESVAKSRFEEICEKGIFVNLEERDNWLSEWKDCYKASLQKCVEKMMAEELKSDIRKLEKQISYSNQNIAMGSKAKAHSMVQAIMVEQGLTNNQAFTKVYDEVYRDELERIKNLGKKKDQTEVPFFFNTKQVFSQVEFETWNDES
ncbi:hypothetical protein CTI12_AA446970 [Artemisia annua]|uniref:Uncharacterized protein n=1 Tax=Artemisia annua TaxID=35608 RepID=A0A2U1LW47_ARTAN|nr:hypothetical protein CTI12_AA446970 [Artemisia annua]